MIPFNIVLQDGVRPQIIISFRGVCHGDIDIMTIVHSLWKTKNTCTSVDFKISFRSKLSWKVCQINCEKGSCLEGIIRLYSSRSSRTRMPQHLHLQQVPETVPRCSLQDTPRVDDTPCTLTMEVTPSLSTVTWTPLMADGRYAYKVFLTKYFAARKWRRSIFSNYCPFKRSQSRVRSKV